MPDSRSPGFDVPDQTIPRVCGFLNFVVGSALLVAGLGSLTLFGLAPALYRVQLAHQRLAFENQKMDWLDNVEHWDRLAKTAATEEDRERYRAASREVGPEPWPPRATLGPRMLWDRENPWATAFVLVKAGVGVVLNAAMIASGAGLLRLRPSGRRLAVRVAALKIVRLAVIAALTVFVAVPYNARRYRRELTEDSGTNRLLVTSPPFREEAAEGARVLARSDTVEAVGMFALGSIYPAVTIVVLSRRRVRAACRDAEPPRPPPALDPQ